MVLKWIYIFKKVSIIVKVKKVEEKVLYNKFYNKKSSFFFLYKKI